MSLFALPLMPLMVGLGFWQLDRADEKRQLLAQQEVVVQASPQVITPAFMPELYTPLKLVGRFEQHRHFLLDNQVVDGRLGYDVISPFLDNSGAVVLVNRGWVAAPPTRAEKPVFATPENDVTIYASAGYHLKQPFLLVPDESATDWPIVVQAIDVELFSELLSESLTSYFARAEPGQAGSFIYHYQNVAVLPEKHTAYAVQWFAMTAALLLLYVWFGFNASKNRNP